MSASDPGDLKPADRDELVRLLNVYRAKLAVKRDATKPGVDRHFASHAVCSADDLIRQLERNR